MIVKVETANHGADTRRARCHWAPHQGAAQLTSAPTSLLHADEHPDLLLLLLLLIYCILILRNILITVLPFHLQHIHCQ